MHHNETLLPALELLKSRRSIRKYLDKPVPESLIDQILNAASWAPSAHNRQPWRFVVINSFETKHKLATAMGERLREDLSADQIEPGLVEKDIKRSYLRITEAPLLILLCLRMGDMDEYPDKRRQDNERLMAVQSTAMAGQNLLLAAHAAGLGACWLCAPLFCQSTVRETLSLPGDWEPQGLITIGYPAEDRNKSRFPFSERVLIID